MKKRPIIVLVTTIVTFSWLLLQCQHEDEIIPVNGPDPTKIVRGTEAINCPNCTPLTTNGASADFSTAGVPSGQWYNDKAHSNAMWETPYQGVGSLLTGRFNYFAVKNFTFDETDPTKIAFEGFVRLNTVNTGEPGRDGGCLLTTYKTAAGKTTEPENLANIKSTSVKYSDTDAGYIATADLTFLGVTKSVTMKIDYVKQTHFTGSPGYTLAGVQASFVFKAISDFGLVTTNVGDQVTVRLDLTLRKKD